ncbi:MAG: hypothetical protein GY834_13135 [Bacteroidetes bacterium]|nr:hypothetical protein [Bacteroidota bacterium]
MLVKSEFIEIGSTSEQLYTFLSDLRNFEKLMPEQIRNWVADSDSCSFEIEKMATIELRIIKRKPYRFLQIAGEGKTPFPLQLRAIIKESGEQSSISFEIKAEVNSMMSMMVKRPLQNLVDILGQKLKEFM